MASTPVWQIEAAPLAYEQSPDPGVIHLVSGEAHLLALFDGWGSWGDGMAAAARTRARLEERWRSALPGTIESIAADIEAEARVAERDFHDDLADSSFSAVAVWLRGAAAHVAAAGAFHVLLIGESGVTPVFRPRKFVDQLVEMNKLNPEEATSFAGQDIHLGPFLASGAPAGTPEAPVLRTSGPHEIPPDRTLLVIHETPWAVLSGRPAGTWLDGSAASLQGLGVTNGVPAHPLLLVRRPAP